LIKAPANFTPHVAACVINEFRPKSFFDPHIGWGGRVLAAMCCDSVKEIYGCDLQKESVDASYRLHAAVDSQSYKEFHHMDCVEFMQDTKNKFDLILTSPPFHDLEQYGNINIDPDANKWYNNYVIPFLDGCKACLSRNGHIVLHLEDSTNIRLLKLFLEGFNNVGLNITRQLKYGRRRDKNKQQIMYVLQPVR
jgi:tRNA1(Val) A37 N6-methylase TrmN6